MMMMRENYIQFKRRRKKKKKKKEKKNSLKAQYTFSVSFFSLPLMIMGFQWTFSVLLQGL